jgi:hypothetical protein
MEMFAPRFLADCGKSAAYLKCLVESNIPLGDLTQLFFLYTARAQPIFADFVRDIYWSRYGAGATYLGRGDAEAFIRRALDNGRMQRRWTESMVERVAGLGQTLSPIAAVGFLGYFEDEFSHAPNSKLPMPERQVQAWQKSADALLGREKVNFRQNASSAQKIG